MAIELNQIQPNDRAALVGAALSLTRLRMPMRHACALVLISGYRNTDAARAAGVERRNLASALCRLRWHLSLVLEEYRHAMDT